MRPRRLYLMIHKKKKKKGKKDRLGEGLEKKGRWYGGILRDVSRPKVVIRGKRRPSPIEAPICTRFPGKKPL